MEHVPRRERLRRLIVQLGQLPPSKQRDDLLRRVRHRAVATEVATWEASCWRRNRVERDALTLERAEALTLQPADPGTPAPR